MTEHLDKDARREQILDAATTMFITQGYENSTVDDIAKEAGLSKGSIYWYFKSKLEILFALTDRCIYDSQQEVVRLADLDELGPESLYKAHRIISCKKGHNTEHDQLFGQLVGLAGRYPEIQARLDGYYHKWDNVTASLLQRGIDKGVFKETNVIHIGQAITALYDGLHFRSGIDTEVDIVGVLETTTKLLYDALIVKTQETDNTENKE
jgi:AcrR family transcriptional regulator